MSDVVTGEAVALELRLAKLPSRTLAGLLDLAVQFAVIYLLFITGAALLSGVDQAIAVAYEIILLVLVLIGYPVVFETLSRGRTLGKMALGIRVVREDGGPISFRHALVRGLVGAFVDRQGLLLVIPGLGYALGMIMMLVSRQGKRLGDMAAGTVVLQERVPAARQGYVAAMPPPLAGWATTLDLTRLDDGLALSVRQFLARAGQLDDRARAGLGARLAGAVAAVTTPPPPPGTPGWAFLAAVLAERRRREEAKLARRPYGPEYAGHMAPPWPGAQPAAAWPAAPGRVAEDPSEPEPIWQTGPFVPPA